MVDAAVDEGESIGSGPAVDDCAVEATAVEPVRLLSKEADEVKSELPVDDCVTEMKRPVEERDGLTIRFGVVVVED